MTLQMFYKESDMFRNYKRIQSSGWVNQKILIMKNKLENI